MVQAQRTYTNHTITALARCVGCFCTSSGWYKHSEPPRTYTNHTSTELARCEGCFYTRSGWFKHSEPQRTYTNHTRSTLHTVLSALSRFMQVHAGSKLILRILLPYPKWQPLLSHAGSAILTMGLSLHSCCVLQVPHKHPVHFVSPVTL